MKEPTFRDVLGPLGAAIMEIVSRQPGATVRDVATALTADGRPPPAYTTVMTVMGRLHNQGLLLREQHGRQYAYRAPAGESELVNQLSRRAVDKVLDRYGAAALRHFATSLAEVDPALRERAVRLADSES